MDTLSPVAAGFAPSAEEVRWARAVLGAGDSVTTVDGRGHDSRVAPVGVPARRPSLRVVSSFGCRPGMSRDSARPGACPSLPRSPGPDRERPGAEAAAERRQRAPAPVVACGLARGAGVVQGGEIRTQEIDTHEAAAGLLDRSLDWAIVRQTAPVRGTTATSLYADRFVAALPVHHPAAEAFGPLDLADLAGAPWVWLHRHIPPDYHDAMAALCRAAGFSPVPNHWGRPVTSQIAMVECGLGVTVVPAAASASPPPSGSDRSATRRRPSNPPP
ncbi:LysR family substrate-binding domain-containing protein [Streptomyces griseoruber]|uniref:LysR family substrate-binding domain-containing protein n=1 Tax=Streptomyces griseoruber TaxID=1943 RepID=UPI0037AD36D9